MVPLNAHAFLSYAQNLIATHSVRQVRKEMERLLLLGHCLGNYGTNYNVYGFVYQGYVIKVIKEDNLPDTYFHHCPPKNSIVAPYFLWPVFKTESEEIIIQPFAETSKKQREVALRVITYELQKKLKVMGKDELLTLTDIWPDCVSCNTGIYNKKPVIIDFSHKYME